MLYRETVLQAHILAFADNFWLMLTAYFAVLLLIPFLRRVAGRRAPTAQSTATDDARARDPGLPAPAD